MVATGATVKLYMTRIMPAQISNALRMTELLGSTVGKKVEVWEFLSTDLYE
jgi:hypothetical protein